MTTQMIIRIDPDIKNKFNKLARVEGKSSSQMVRELMVDYIKDRDINVSIDDLWDRIGAKLKAKGKRPQDVNRAVQEARRKKQ